MRGVIFTSIVIVLFAVSVQARAAEDKAAQNPRAEIGCPDRVDHVSVEQGHLKSFPALLAPDDDMADPQTWSDLDTSKSSDRAMDEITVHCFYNKAESKKTDVLLPKNVKKCTFSSRGKFACEVGN